MPNEIAGFLLIEQWPPVPDALFWTTLLVVAAAVLGEVVYRVLSLPRLVGYSAIGVLVSLAGHGVPAGALNGTMRLIVDLALALLLFELGSRVSLRWLRNNPALLATSFAEAVLTFAAVYFALTWFGQGPTVAVACATLAVASSAAVAGRVASELHAAGQVTERMVVLTALNTFYAVLMLKLVTGWLYIETRNDWVQSFSQPLYTFGGSLLLALLLARAVALVSRKLDLRDENSALMLLGLIVLTLTGAKMLGLSTLLVPLLAGVALRNTNERPWVWPRHFGTAGGVLVLMLFIIVGAAWTLDSLAAGAMTALVLLGARLAGKGVAVLGLARFSGVRFRQGLAVTLCLMPFSATALVLLADLRLSHPEFAAQIAPIVLSAIALMELVGPLAVQWSLRLVGETGHRATVAGSPSPAPTRF